LRSVDGDQRLVRGAGQTDFVRTLVQEGGFMRIGDICTRSAVYCDRTMRIPLVAQLMRNRNVGEVIVVEPDGDKVRPVGVVTDRDLVLEVLAQGVAPEALAAQDLMQPGVLTVGEDETVYDAIWHMRSRNVRRLPVIDSDGHLVGVLSQDDVIGFLSQEMTQVARVSPDQIKAERAHRAPVAG
jgi:signal-transduction protein with cAMP-binding, CBS, and nucleotidyltransferase domain